ncbi:hypothetical protein BS78_04G124400 [Paspalum vaginatum]|nr:hypothetical protein BS78_04G124400 [Paspalum vaginatum]
MGLQLARTGTHLVASFSGVQVAGGFSLANLNVQFGCTGGARVYCLDGGARRWAGHKQQAAAGTLGLQETTRTTAGGGRAGLGRSRLGRATTRCWRRETSGGWPAQHMHVVHEGLWCLIGQEQDDGELPYLTAAHQMRETKKRS